MNPASDPTPDQPLRTAASPLPEAAFTDTPEPIVAANSGWWQRIGGGSLTVSIIVHAFILLAMFMIVYTISVPAKEEIEFLPGGGGGGKGTDATVAQKRRAASVSAPKTRTVSLSTNAEVSLPDIATSMSDFSSLTASAPMGGGMGGGSGGLNGKGSGGAMGDGRGTGVGPGIGNGFISIPKLFGTDIEARRMAVVLDMSGSMYAFLPVVIKEVDKVAPGSTVILNYGCGMGDAEIRNPDVISTTNRDFDKDRIVTSLLDPESRGMTKENRDSLYALVKKRPKTFYVPSSGVGSTWVALMDQKLKDADAIYWFADFADPISSERMEEVARRLRGRKQKLYIHPSNPNWLQPGSDQAINVAKVEKELVKPSGGKVIKQEVKKDVPVKEEKDKPKTDA